MNGLKVFLGVLFVIIFLTGCSSDDGDTILGDNNNIVKVRFDLQEGFEDSYVNIYINGVNYFEAYLSNIAPFAGPQSSFITYLPRKSNTLIVCLRTFGPHPAYKDTLVIEFGDLSEYFIGMSITEENELNVIVQDKGFAYF